jgi:hypothetical protein
VLALLFVGGGLVPVPRTFMSLAAGGGVRHGGGAGDHCRHHARQPDRFPFRALSVRRTAVALGRSASRSAGDHERRQCRRLAHRRLCRLASPIPSTIQNAIFGLTRIELWPYLWATFLFTIPQILLYVYLGAVGKAALLGESGGVNLGVMIAGGLTFLGVVLMITRRVRESMRALESSP